MPALHTLLLSAVTVLALFGAGEPDARASRVEE